MGKVVLVVVGVVLLMFAYKLYQDKSSYEDKVEHVEKLMEKQQADIEGYQEKLQEVSESVAAVNDSFAEERKVLQRQITEANKQSETMQKQIDETVRLNSINKEMTAAQEQIGKNALRASHLATGLQTAAGLKVAIVEHYLAENKFPGSNRIIGLPSPKSYNSDVIESVTVSHRGRITVVYKQKPGQDKGAISLIPSVKKDRVNWRCETRDFDDIQLYLPDCRYIGSEI